MNRYKAMKDLIIKRTCNALKIEEEKNSINLL